jgi:hypothetical protein
MAGSGKISEEEYRRWLTPSEAVALVVGTHSAQQVSENWNSMQAKLPADFWAELLQEKLIDSAAKLPKPFEDSICATG